VPKNGQTNLYGLTYKRDAARLALGLAAAEWS